MNEWLITVTLEKENMTHDSMKERIIKALEKEFKAKVKEIQVGEIIG